MSAPTGNTNASKWTKTQTNQLLDQIETLAWDESIHTLTQALLRVKSYKQLWSYFKKIWELDGDIMDRIYYIEQIFISKLEDGALFKRLNPSACFFILRNNYGYNTRGESELPSHLRAEFEEPIDIPRSDTAEKKPETQSATTISRKDFTPQYSHNELADRFGMDIRKNPKMYDGPQLRAVTIK
ncbi:MAG: hypothetical protein JST90_01010 [Bacteroidetes bacterium]|nr:hypothetical protein [Bacteroidota bacterium]